MFFRIERTGPPGGGPARSLLPVPYPHPLMFRAAVIRDGLRPAGLYIPARLVTSSLLRVVSRPSWKYPPGPAKSRTPPRATRSRVPRSQRLRPGRRRFAPFHTDRSTPLSCSVPQALLTASHPRVGAGNVSRPRLRVGPAAHGTHCLPVATSSSRPAPSALEPTALRLRRISPARLSGPLPSVHSPLHLSDSAPSVFSGFKLPATGSACQID